MDWKVTSKISQRTLKTNQIPSLITNLDEIVHRGHHVAVAGLSSLPPPLRPSIRGRNEEREEQETVHSLFPAAQNGLTASSALSVSSAQKTETSAAKLGVLLRSICSFRAFSALTSLFQYLAVARATCRSRSSVV